MRVLFGLLLCLSVSVLGVASEFAVTAVSTPNGFVWRVAGDNAPAGDNPPLSLTVGNTYTFDLSNAGAFHPFGFGTTDAPQAVAALDNTKYTVTTTGDCGGNANTGVYIGNPCKVTLAILNTASATPLWYKCTAHASMVGQLNIAAAAASSSSSSSSAGATGSSSSSASSSSSSTGNAMPVIMGGTITSNTFRITGNNATAGYYFTHNGTVYQNPTLNVTAGSNVTFSFEWVNSKFHPFGFSFRPNTDGVAISQDYFPDLPNQLWLINSNLSCDTTTNATVRLVKLNVTTNPTMPVTSPCVITIPSLYVIVPSVPTQMYYRCAVHPLMIGAININPAPAVAGSSSSSTGNTAMSSSSSGTGSGSGSGNTAMSSSSSGTGSGSGNTAISSSSSGNNPPPVSSSSSGAGTPQPGTSSSSTGGNSASTIAGAGLSIMIAFIAAIIMA